MASRDDEIDELYQRPLGEFTAARNALAKAAGKDGAAIKALEKPSLPAWAVNQLYWRHRRVYDRLVAAATKVRDANAKMIAGKSADVRGAESAHADAIKAALEGVRATLEDAGESATAATLHAVTETLRALPAADDPGRLTKPLKPLGFEALAGLVSPAVVREAAATGKREQSRARASLDEAREDERRAEAALAKAKRTLQQTEREHAAAQEKVQALASRLRELSREVDDLTQQHDAAAAARAKWEAQVRD